MIGVAGSCAVGTCRFCAVGTVVLTREAAGATVHRPFGVCALHRELVLDEAITNPVITRVQWHPRADWSNDGAVAA